MKPGIRVLLCLAFVSAPALCGQAEWRKIPFLEPDAVLGLCARGDSLWVASNAGVLASGDGGATWSENGSGFRPGKVVGVAAGSRRLAACQGRILFISEDDGRTWRARDSLETGNFSRMDAWKDTLFAWHSVFAGSAPQGIRFSTDDGLTWAALALDVLPMAKARIFGADTFSFAGSTLYRVNSDGPKAMSTLTGPIQEVAMGAKNLFALSDSLIYKASDPKGPWTRIITPKVPGVVIRGVAADSECIAVQTPMGISLSRNRGRDWEYLGSNFANLSVQSLHLGAGALYVRRGLDDAAPHRYSIANGKWDTIFLPFSPQFTRRLFAAEGDRIGYLAQARSGPDSIFLSRGPGGRFQFAGLPPKKMSYWVTLMLGRRSEMFVLADTYFWSSRYDGARWDSTGSSGYCSLLGYPIHVALNDSGLFFYSDGLRHFSSGTTDCNVTDIRLPDGYPREDMRVQQVGSCMAGWGGSLYLGWTQGLWVREETSGTPLGAKSKSDRRAPANGLYPVRVWALPGGPAHAMSSKNIDARGAVRR